MNKFLELLVGIILIVVPIVAAINWVNWGDATIQFLKGGVIVFIVIIGLLFLMLGISDLKE